MYFQLTRSTYQKTNSSRWSVLTLSWVLGVTIFTSIGIPHTVTAQSVKISASINDSTIGTEEGLVYTISIEGAPGQDIQTPEAPAGEGLSLLQSIPNTRSNVSIINGAVTQGYSYSWTYRPTGAGIASLGSTTVRVANTVYKTNPISVTIVPQSQRPTRTQRRRDPFASLFSTLGPQNTEELPELTDRDIFIRAIPSKTSVVQNEQVTIEYQLFYRAGIQLRQSRLTDSWDAEGFWREELEVETRPIPEIVVENGLRYNKITLKRAAVFPTRAGDLSIDSLRIESEALIPTSSQDPFQRMFSTRSRFQPVKLGSASIHIETAPFPEGAPASFSGAVGSYSFSSKIDRTELEVGESIKLTVTVSGSGNLATMDTPRFNPPAAFELYEPQVELNLNRRGTRLTGSKSFSYVLVARTNGNFELPSIEFSAYDPRSGNYKIMRSDPITVSITGSATTPMSVTATTNGLPVDDVAAPFSDAGEWSNKKGAPLHTAAWPYTVLLLPLLFLSGLFLYQRHEDKLAGDISYARNRRAHPLAKKNLKKAVALLEAGDTIAFFAELERAVMGFIGNRLNVSERGLTRQQLDESLRRASVSDDIRSRLSDLLNVCDQGRFAPVGFGRLELEAASEDAATIIVALSSILGGKR